VKRRGCFPGSFDPLTIAHLRIAEAVIAHHLLTTLTFVVSERTLAKEDSNQPSAELRAENIRQRITERPSLQAAITPHQLLADIALGYDLIVVGADKWIQIHEDRWYEDTASKRATLAHLPFVVVIPRPPYSVDDLRAYDHDPGFSILELRDPTIAEISSTAVRNGRTEWLA
jgi:nicotinic acid mononucleotide adenylyltransferase